MMLQTLSCEMYDRELEPVHFSLVEALMPLTRLQHLHLTQCVPLKYNFVLHCRCALQLQGLHPCNIAVHASNG